MRYCELINETITATSLDGRKVVILKNPPPNVLIDRVKRTRGLRGIILGGDVFWANGYSLIHSQIGRAVGADDSYGAARLILRWVEGRPKLMILPNTKSLGEIEQSPQMQRLSAYIGSEPPYFT